jgi:hypothetical protein
VSGAPYYIAMLPAGYLYKAVSRRPEWMASAPQVKEIYSVSGCISENFGDYIKHWKHNGYWLFDDPLVMHDIARDEGVDLRPMTLFYYEVFDQEFHETARTWSTLQLVAPAQVRSPAKKTLHGFDVVTFSQNNAPECSPLSCNGLAGEVTVNARGLFETLAEAQVALESGVFERSEPGPFRIFAVYTVLAGGTKRLVRSQST